MTNKEAIANLNHIYGMVAPDIQRSLDVAIKSLENQTTEGDLISREALKDDLKKGHELGDMIYVGRVLDIIDNAPTVPQINVFCENADEKAIEDMKAELQSVLDNEKPQGDLISREAIQKAYNDKCIGDCYGCSYFKIDKTDNIEHCGLIDNAPSVEPIYPYLSDNEVKQPCLNSPCERPQGDCISREALSNVILNDRKLDGVNANWEVNRILAHIYNAPPVEQSIKVVCRSRNWSTDCTVTSGFEDGYRHGYRKAKEDIAKRIKEQYNEHHELIPCWLSVGDLKGGAE